MIDQAVQQELASEKDWPIDATNSYIKYLDDVSLLKDMKVSKKKRPWIVIIKYFKLINCVLLNLPLKNFHSNRDVNITVEGFQNLSL